MRNHSTLTRLDKGDLKTHGWGWKYGSERNDVEVYENLVLKAISMQK